jgi:hypothetical protein
MGRGLSSLRPAAVGAGLVALLTAAALAGTPAASAGSGAAEGDPVLLDFEDVTAGRSGSPAAPPVGDAYAARGVVFDAGVIPLRFSSTSIPALPGLPRSGEVVVTSCYAQEFCTPRIGMTFSRRMSTVSLHVGSSTALPAAADVQLSVLDAGGAVVGQERVTLPATGAAVPATATLSVSEAADIRSAEVTWVGGDAGRLVVDDVSFTPYVAAPQLVSDPPSLVLQVQDEALTQAVTLTNIGDAPTRLVAAAYVPAAADPAGAAATVTVEDPGCLDLLSSGEACSLTAEVEPLGVGLLEGEIVVFRDPDDTGDPTDGEVLLAIPVEVTVGEVPPPTTSPPTDGPTPTEPTDTSVPTPGPTVGPSDVPGGDDGGATTGPAGEDPWYRDLLDTVADNGGTWLLPVLLAIGVAVGFLARGRGGRAHRRRRSVPRGTATPEVVVRPDRGSVTVDQSPVSRLTLTVRTPPATVLPQEEEP